MGMREINLRKRKEKEENQLTRLREIKLKERKKVMGWEEQIKSKEKKEGEINLTKI